MSIILGCIADDLTGATDLAMMLVREGMKTVQIVGEPSDKTPIPDADAVVIALKSRSIPANEAVKISLASCEWLQRAGAKQVFFKYCSTFDSTNEGNIGPVTDALMSKLNCPYTIVCPSFPENGRTVYRGHLFVNNVLLSESSLRNHPLNPMHDSNLNRVLSAQSHAHISNIYVEDIEKGAEAISKIMQANHKASSSIYVVDATNDHHLRSIGRACKNLPLITGGSAVAQNLPYNFRKDGLLSPTEDYHLFKPPQGSSVILSGSCSEATRNQVNFAKSRIPHFHINALDVLDGKSVVNEALTWAKAELKNNQTVLIYSSADPEEVDKIQNKRGRIEVGSKVEAVLSDIARQLKSDGIRRFIIAGGETSGAVIEALGINTMEIGPEIDPGVPWTKSIEKRPLAIALKSGNFGTEDFFIKSISQLDSYQNHSKGDQK